MLQKLPFHLLFWLFALNLCAFIIGNQGGWQNAYMLTIIYAPVPIASAYFIDRVLIEKYLLKKRRLKFILYLVYVLIISMFLVMVNNTIIFITIAQYQHQLMPAATQDSIVLFSTLYLIVFLFVSTQSINKYSIVYSEKEAALKSIAETELRFLKTQLNPHFLFNTLNNLYSLALQQSKQTPEAILKLSQLLDQVLHANKSMKIPLEQEIATMNDFIYLESLRYGERIQIDMSINVPQIEKHMVPPLCILVLIENCFKHGVQPSAGQTKIGIRIFEEGQMLTIKTINRVYEDEERGTNGIGLQNLRKQLSFIYGTSYQLLVEQKNSSFHVTLALPI